MDNLEVDPEQFTRDAGAFGQLGDLAESISSGLVNGIRLQGNFAGTDKFGKMFSDSFYPGVENLSKAVSSSGTSWHNTEGGLVDSAKGYVQTDQANAESIPNMSQPRRTR